MYTSFPWYFFPQGHSYRDDLKQGGFCGRILILMCHMCIDLFYKRLMEGGAVCPSQIMRHSGSGMGCTAFSNSNAYRSPFVSKWRASKIWI